MSVEFIGMIHHRQASEIHPPSSIILDRGYIREFAQAAEAGGFDRVLVGYFASKAAQYLQEPQLETDASANDYGQADIKIANAIQIEGLPPVNVHTYTFKAGTNTLSLGKGACLILGFVDDSARIPVYDAGLSNEGNIRDLRWLFN